MLGIAYACSIGGVATLVGTPPNLSLARIFEITFPDAPPLVFGQWLVMALPISIIMLVIAWLLITKVFFRVPEHITVDKTVVEEQARALGPWPTKRRRCSSSSGSPPSCGCSVAAPTRLHHHTGLVSAASVPRPDR